MTESNMDNRKKQTDIDIDENTFPYVEKIADSMPGGFFIYHADGDEKLIYFNKSMLRIFGCDTREEFLELTHNSFKGIVHPDDLEEVERSIKEQVHENQYDMDYVEYRIVKKDGTIRWVEDYGHFIHTTVYGDVFYVFIEDATDRLEKRMAELEEMNEELRNAYDRESQYKKALIQNAISFFEVNLSKNQFMTQASRIVDERAKEPGDFGGVTPVTQYSRYVEEVWADRINESERASFRQFFDPQRLIRCHQKGELEQVYEAWSTDSAGRRRLIRYAVLLGRQGYTGDVIALAVCTDITEQVKRQNLLQIALRQAQSANIAKTAFLANMSHDIRTPLNAIVGYANLLLEHCEDPKTIDYVNKIKEAGEGLFSIIKESMEVTWAESGKAVLTEISCNIDDIIRELVKNVSLMAEKKCLDFYVECDDIRHRLIYADTVRLKEIITQLLDNAIKYTDAGGYVRLTVREEHSAPEGYAPFVFTVQDNGIGMSDELKENVFQAFARERNTAMSRILGSGLGLTVVKTFVDMMEGTVNVESRAGGGSTFTVKILFRLDENSQEEAAIQAASPPVQALDRLSLVGKRILLVEDNDLNAEITEELLTQSGFVIESAINGEMALEKVRNSAPGYYCAVLMDIQMPVMDGYEASRRIRKLENRALANIPIIALSANAFPEDQQKSIECGMDAHFSKPIEIDGLIDLLCRVLAQVQK